MGAYFWYMGFSAEDLYTLSTSSESRSYLTCCKVCSAVADNSSAGRTGARAERAKFDFSEYF